MDAARWTCGDCGSSWAAGAPCCPSCRGLVYVQEPEAAETTPETPAAKPRPRGA